MGVVWESGGRARGWALAKFAQDGKAHAFVTPYVSFPQTGRALRGPTLEKHG